MSVSVSMSTPNKLIGPLKIVSSGENANIDTSSRMAIRLLKMAQENAHSPSVAISNIKKHRNVTKAWDLGAKKTSVVYR